MKILIIAIPGNKYKLLINMICEIVVFYDQI